MSPNLPAMLAGMPSISFTDVARLRLEVISFFLMGLLASAAVVMLLWNYLARDFPRLPRLSYAKACGVVILWGLLFVVVLTMISGARELMTPGAWVKNGVTYKLQSRPGDDSSQAEQKQQRDRWAERSMRVRNHLYLGLMTYALEHEGRYPNTTEELQIDPAMWDLPDLPGTRYIFIPGLTKSGPRLPLVYEPEVYEGDHFVLFTDGEIEELPFAEIVRQVEAAE